MICKTCGNEIYETDTNCGVCGAPIPYNEDMDSGDLESAGKKNIWPWDAANETAPEVDEEQVSEPEEPVEAEQPEMPVADSVPNRMTESKPEFAPTRDNMFISAESSAPNGKRHLEFNWDSQAFHIEEKRKTEDIKFDWGNLFANDAPKESETDEPAVISPNIESASAERNFDTGAEPIEPLYAVHPNDLDASVPITDNDSGIGVDDLDFSFGISKKTDKILDDRTKQYNSVKAIEPPRRFTEQIPLMPPDISSHMESTEDRSPEFFATSRVSRDDEMPEPEELDFFKKQQAYKIEELNADSDTEPESAYISDSEPIVFPEYISDSEPIAESTQEPDIDPIPDFRESYKEYEQADKDKNSNFAPIGPNIANLGIFETNVASPFEIDKGGVASPFDPSDDGIASLLGLSNSVREREPIISKSRNESDADAIEKTLDPLEEAMRSVPNFFEETESGEAEPEPEVDEKIKNEESEADRQTAKIQDIVNQPVVFPFDEEMGYVEAEPAAEEVSNDNPEDETVTYAEPKDEDYEDEFQGNNLKNSKKSQNPSLNSSSLNSSSPESSSDSSAKSGAKGTAAKKAADNKKGHKWIILVDILVILLVLAGVCFAVIHFAPNSGVSQALNSGFSKVTELLGISEADAEITDDDVKTIAPQPDKEALVSAQAAFFNHNIAEVVYDPEAKFDSSYNYKFSELATAKPIENDYWTTDDDGYPVLYDETAVGCLIKFNSELVSYTGGQQSDILSNIETGSDVESEVADYAASITGLVFKKLGIGEILTDGTYYYVFTNETVIETKDGAPQEITRAKVYKLLPDITTMQISEIETIS